MFCDDLDFYTSELPSFLLEAALLPSNLLFLDISLTKISSTLTLMEFNSDLRHESLLLVI